MALNFGQAVCCHILSKSLLRFKHVHLVSGIFEVSGNRIV